MNKIPNITVENYEFFLVDFLDNQLNADLTEELLVFLDNHPEIKQEIEGIEDFFLTPETTTINFSSLKKQESKWPENVIKDDNLDEFLIKELEEGLNEEENESLRVYLIENPEKTSDRNLVRNLKLSVDHSVEYDSKELIYKLSVDKKEAISAENIEEYCIAFTEGILDDLQKKEVNDFLSANPNQKVILDFYSKIKMIADPELQFPDKESLKKKATIIWFNNPTYRYIASIAAVLVFFLMFPSLLNNGIKTVNISAPSQRLNIEKPHKINVAEVSTQEHTFKKSSSGSILTKSDRQYGKRESVSIEKGVAREPQPYVPEAVELKTAKPEFCFASGNTYHGYYEVCLQKDNFITENPALVKRVVKGVRNLLNIDADAIKAPKDKLTIWDVADAGIKGIGALTENDFSITRK